MPEQPRSPICELSAIVPAYNEASHLRESLKSIIETLLKITESFEVVIIDDGSDDNTWSVVLHLHYEEQRVRGIRLARRYGKEAALAAGLERCGGAGVIILDADLQHPLDLLPTFYELWKREGAEVVQGVKTTSHSEPRGRRILSTLFGAVANRLTGMEFDRSSDFKLLDRKVIEAWQKMPERRTCLRGMISWLGFRSIDVPFVVQRRADGKSKYTFLRLLRSAWHAISGYSYLPLRLIHTLSILFLVFSFLLGAWAFYLKLSGVAVDGFTTVITLQLMIGGFILLSLALVAEYLAAIYEEVKQRPRYVIAEVSE